METNVRACSQTTKKPIHHINDPTPQTHTNLFHCASSLSFLFMKATTFTLSPFRLHKSSRQSWNMFHSLSLFLVLFLCFSESAFGWVSSQQNVGIRPVSTSSSSLNMGVRSTLGRVRDSLLSKERNRKDLKIGIAGFYDRSSKLWEEVWGEVCKMPVTVVLVVLFVPHCSR